MTTIATSRTTAYSRTASTPLSSNCWQATPTDTSERTPSGGSAVASGSPPSQAASLDRSQTRRPQVEGCLENVDDVSGAVLEGPSGSAVRVGEVVALGPGGPSPLRPATADTRARPRWTTSAGRAPTSTPAASRPNSRRVKVRVTARGTIVTTAARCSREATRTRSAVSTISAVSSRARNALEDSWSTPSLARVSRANGSIGEPSCPQVPALCTRTWEASAPSRVASAAAARRSAIGERQMLPVQTNRSSKVLSAVTRLMG